MRRIIFPSLLLFAVLVSCTGNKYKTKVLKDSNGYTYEMVANDPSGTRIYTLGNGLKVYLSHNPNEPRIMGLIGVRAGSNSDPVETTGLAHYFEHIMFKGTSSYGTTDWDKEKPLLDSISNLFEIYRVEKNEAKRKEIYKLIDKLSVEASKYAVPNEYDKMLTEMGAKYTNAFTSNDRTAYMNDIPANELKRWLAVEYNRFGDVALRLFHTELETVYEEFNMYQDRDWSRAYNALSKALFPKGPLGRDVIGYPEHLKNPSMVNILKFKETWYVPNNMTICLSGDIDMEETIKMVDETFGRMESKVLPTIDKVVEDPIAQAIEIEVFGPDAENLFMAYRFDGDKPEDVMMLSMIGRILYNGTAGLIDINLIQDQKVLDAYAYFNDNKDYGVFNFSVTPKNDQTLEEAKDLILQEIEKLKKGEFPDWMPTAVANQQRLSMLRNLQGNWRVFGYLEAFVREQNWSDVISYADELEKITKEEIMAYANKFFTDSYVAVYKRTGEAKDLVKVPKPPITPIKINREDQSQFYTEWKEIPRDTIQPVFVDYSSAIQTTSLREGVDLSYIKNDKNEFFTHYYIIDAGKNHNLKTPMAINYLPYIGTKNRTATELKQELFRYGLNTYVWSGDDRSWIYISGLNRNYKKGLELMEEIITQSVPDTIAYKKYAERTIKERNDAKLSQDNILWDGLWNWAMYGSKSPFNDVLTNEEIRNIDPQELTELVKAHFTYPHRVFYFGPSALADVKKEVENYHKLPEVLVPLPEEKVYPELDIKGKEVLIADYDMSQVNIILMAKGEPFSKDIYIGSRLFNQYFGNSMSSIVFQEIRESQGMAYSAWLGYNSPSKPDRSFYLMGFIGTQTDKLDMASSSLERLLDKMIENDKSLEISRKAIMNTIASSRIMNEQIYFQWLRNQELGFDYDVRKDFYSAAENGNMDDLRNFFNTYIKGKPYNYLIVGDTKALDKKMLNRMGKVKVLTLEELFGY
jgi:predicted Zn-dependent peptidase